MMSLKELGYTGKYSLSDYLDYLDELGAQQQSTLWVHIAASGIGRGFVCADFAGRADADWNSVF